MRPPGSQPSARSHRSTQKRQMALPPQATSVELISRLTPHGAPLFDLLLVVLLALWPSGVADDSGDVRKEAFVRKYGSMTPLSRRLRELRKLDVAFQLNLPVTHP